MKPVLSRLGPCLLALAFLTFGLAAEAATDGKPPRGKTLSRNIIFEGIYRHYRVYVPALAKKSARPAPVVVVLHGGRGRALGVERYTAFDRIADREGFVVIYPQGYRNHWNDGRATTRHETHVKNLNDVAFIIHLVDRVGRSVVRLDRKRTYVAGTSSGGMMAFRAACDAAERFAAVAAVAANMPVSLWARCSPDAKISILVMNGTDDPLVPWKGGSMILGRRYLGSVVSTQQTMRFWAHRNGCAASPTVTDLPDEDPDDGTRVRLSVFSDCRHSAVVLYGVESGGHTWPGRVQYRPIWVAGKTSKDIDGSEVIWEFFKRHKRR